jgi:hypothetical protein
MLTMLFLLTVQASALELPKAAEKLGGDGMLAAILVFLVLQFLSSLVDRWFQFMARRERKEIANAAACNYPPELADRTREAVARQSFNEETRRADVTEMRRSFGELVAELRQLSGNITILLAEFRASRGASAPRRHQHDD